MHAAADTCGMEEEDEKRMGVEAELAESYAVLVEIFDVSSGVGGDCILVAGIGGFEGAQRLATSAAAVNIYLMPYLSPEDSLRIAQELQKSECSRRVLVRNPELLKCKLAALEAMKAERNKEPIHREQLVREHDGEHNLLVAKFRLHLENRLLIAHALRSNTLVALSFLKKLHPRVHDTLPMERTGDLRKQALMEIVTDLQEQYPYSTSEETDINELNQDLICILATQDWEDQLEVGRDIEFKDFQYKEIMEEGSLLGATNSKMTADALRRLVSSLMSSVISKGFLGVDFYNFQLNRDSFATRILKSFRERGDDCKRSTNSRNFLHKILVTKRRLH